MQVSLVLQNDVVSFVTLASLCSVILDRVACGSHENYLPVIYHSLSGGRLFDHIVITDNLTERIAIGFVKQMFQALQYLHECGIAHLDVKVRVIEV